MHMSYDICHTSRVENVAYMHIYYKSRPVAPLVANAEVLDLYVIRIPGTRYIALILVLSFTVLMLYIGLVTAPGRPWKMQGHHVLLMTFLGQSPQII